MSAVFSAATNHLQATLSSPIDVTAARLVTAWVKWTNPTQDTGRIPFQLNGAAGSMRAELRPAAGTVAQVILTGGSAVHKQHTTGITTGDWTFLAVYMPGGLVAADFGITVGGSTETNTYYPTGTPSGVFDLIRIGQGANINIFSNWDGKVAEVAVWSPANLTAANSIRSQALTLKPSDVVGYTPVWYADLVSGATATGGAITMNGTVTYDAADNPIAATDATAPILSLPTATAVTQTTATVGATTDEANGTLRVVVTTSATQPTIAQIKAGQNHLGAAAPYAGSQTITTIGAKTFSATGLTASTTYYAHNLHTDAASNDSNRLTSASFTTLAAPKLASTTLTTDGTTAAASLTGLRWAWWDAAPPNLATAPIISGTTGTTNASGVFTVTLTGTALNVGQTGTLLVLTSDGTAGSTANRAYSAPVVVS